MDSWKFAAAPVLVKLRLVESNVDFLIESFFKLAGFSVHYFDLINVNMKTLNVDVIGDFKAGGTGSFMFKKASFTPQISRLNKLELDEILGYSPAAQLMLYKNQIIIVHPY